MPVVATGENMALLSLEMNDSHPSKFHIYAAMGILAMMPPMCSTAEHKTKCIAIISYSARL